MAPRPQLLPRYSPPSIALATLPQTEGQETRDARSTSPAVTPRTPQSSAPPPMLEPPQPEPRGLGTPQTLTVPVFLPRTPSRSSISTMVLPPPVAPPLAGPDPSALSVPRAPSINDVLSINEIRIAVPPMAGAVVGAAGAHAAKFDAFAEFVTRVVGHPASFYLSVVVVVAWLAIGAVMHWGNTWQLILNSISSAVTLMGFFVLQAAMNRGGRLQAVRDLDQSNRLAVIEQKQTVIQNTLDKMVETQNKQQKMLEALLRAHGIDEAAL